MRGSFANVPWSSLIPGVTPAPDRAAALLPSVDVHRAPSPVPAFPLLPNGNPMPPDDDASSSSSSSEEEQSRRQRGRRRPKTYLPHPHFELQYPALVKKYVFILNDDTVTIQKGTGIEELKPYVIVGGEKKVLCDRNHVLSDPVGGIDYLDARSGSIFYRVGVNYLETVCQEAEKLDFNFAQRIQGLIGAAQHTVWQCLDPDFDPLDRNPLLITFLKARIEGYLAKIQADHVNVGDKKVASHMLQQHKIFTSEWVKKNYKSLTPLVESASVMLIQKCLNVIPLPLSQLPPAIIARILRRYEPISASFAEGVFWQMQELDNIKPGRNPSYKQLTHTSNAFAQAYYGLVRELKAMTWSIETPENSDANDLTKLLLHPVCIDWYDIAGKLPMIHKQYKMKMKQREMQDSSSSDSDANASQRDTSDSSDDSRDTGRRRPRQRRIRRPVINRLRFQRDRVNGLLRGMNGLQQGVGPYDIAQVPLPRHANNQ